MSYCEHDVHCPGHGPAHEAAIGQPDANGYAPWSVFYTPPRQMPIQNSTKDRSLPGKRRRLARKAVQA